MNYTSIEQSKKLIELGLNPETADMYYKECLTTGEFHPKLFEEYHSNELKLDKFALKQYIPCWSVGALLRVCPDIEVMNKDKHYTEYFVPVLYPATKVSGEENSFSFVYRYVYSALKVTHSKDLITCVYEMVIWLLENGYIKKGE